MTKVLVVTSGKGGVGKTTSTAARGAALAQAGERYWPNRQEQEDLFDPEQLSREKVEPFVEMIERWLHDDRNVLDEFSMIADWVRAMNGSEYPVDHVVRIDRGGGRIEEGGMQIL